MNTSTCRKCQKPILWSRTENNKRIPLDPEPVYGGNVVLEANGALARIVTPDKSVKRLQSHFATCPYAGDFRKK